MQKDLGMIITDVARGVHDCLGVAVGFALIMVAILLLLRCCSERRCVVLDCILAVIPSARDFITRAWRGKERPIHEEEGNNEQHPLTDRTCAGTSQDRGGVPPSYNEISTI